jgi:hypothetical protein
MNILQSILDFLSETNIFESILDIIVKTIQWLLEIWTRFLQEVTQYMWNRYVNEDLGVISVYQKYAVALTLMLITATFTLITIKILKRIKYYYLIKKEEIKRKKAEKNFERNYQKQRRLFYEKYVVKLK